MTNKFEKILKQQFVLDRGFKNTFKRNNTFTVSKKKTISTTIQKTLIFQNNNNNKHFNPLE